MTFEVISTPSPIFQNLQQLRDIRTWELTVDVGVERRDDWQAGPDSQYRMVYQVIRAGAIHRMW